MSLTRKFKEMAEEMGFDLAGIAPAGPAVHAKEFAAWLEKGCQAGMQWMARDPARRSSAAALLEGAQSVIVLGLSYALPDPPPEIWNDPSRGRISRYAWGPDYHDRMQTMLKDLERFIQKLAPDSKNKIYVDTGPVLERDYALMAGLGFIGRNSMLIHPELGSMIFLGEIITTLSLEFNEPLKLDNPCGKCRRCMVQCPSQAFAKPYVLDCNRCIAFHTIESKEIIPSEIAELMGNWVFGCDDCQTVCPWTLKHHPDRPHPFLKFDPETCCPPLLELAGMDETEFRERFAGTPVQRLKLHGLLRNVCIALGNWNSPEAILALEKLARHPEALVRTQAEQILAKKHEK